MKDLSTEIQDLIEQAESLLEQNQNKLAPLEIDKTKKETKILERKLKGVTDNTERYKVVDNYLEERDRPMERVQGKSSSFQKSPYGPLTRKIGEDSSGGGIYRQNLDNISLSDKTENRFRGALNTSSESSLELSSGSRFKNFWANSALGRSFSKAIKETSESLPNHYEDALRATFEGIDVRQTKTNEIKNNLTGDSPKVTDRFEAFNRITGGRASIDGFSNLTQKEINLWKKIQREETSKSVRSYGANIDPFDNFKDGKSDIRTSPEGLKASKSRYESQKQELLDINERLNNSYHNFFATQEEIKTSNLNLKDIEEQLKSRKTSLEQDIKAYELGYIRQTDGSFAPPVHSKNFNPTYGDSGYGLGLSNAMKASGYEHAGRALNYTFNPATLVGNVGSSVMENFGIMTSRQKFLVNQARGFAKIPHLAIPALGAYTMLGGMYSDEKPEEILGTALGAGLGLAGWRMGTAYGAAIGTASGRVGKSVGLLTGAGLDSLKSGGFLPNAGKFIGMGLGGVTGLALGYAAGSGVISALGDATSQDSEIRKISKKISTREMYSRTSDTRASLTARSQSLEKLAKSGLNDRSLLLGNEALALRGMLK